jgi:Predicted oxidoreductases (related to aryl-alcohol dehydrogenases)
LGIETIDMFYQHRADPHTPIELVAETVKELIKEGKVKRFGLCEVNTDTIRRAHAIQPITAIQSEYHLMFRRVEDGILSLCEELGIGFVPYSPLNRGFLGGQLNEYTKFDASNDNRAALPRFTPEAMRANLPIVNVLYDFGRTRGLTAAQVAQAWLFNKKPWIVPITGTTKISHLEENIRSANVFFTADEMNEIETKTAAIPIVGDRYNASEQSKVE